MNTDGLRSALAGCFATRGADDGKSVSRASATCALP